MIFAKTELAGAAIVDIERREDARGFFARAYCEREFAEHGLPARMVQTNMSLTRQPGTLRGMHWQHAPHAEDKLVPKGFAHGFVTLADDAVVIYQVSEFYAPGVEGGARWNDPAFGIEWPVAVVDISDKDRNWPDFVRERATR